jgi:hypothetical protein
MNTYLRLNKQSLYASQQYYNTSGIGIVSVSHISCHIYPNIKSLLSSILSVCCLISSSNTLPSTILVWLVKLAKNNMKKTVMMSEELHILIRQTLLMLFVIKLNLLNATTLIGVWLGYNEYWMIVQLHVNKPKWLLNGVKCIDCFIDRFY